ncbi:hypothetical protein EVAR_48835_1 [Eumeta japonica]|uniref:Receptor ligand binding region domain-containing protein n=1 Tax=Eumeta variegata TaxID=151549 RepID=A0A4C1Y983_EUMVA|nr:hypothetical protein EVAR_48835_1 [Eumeta japonica]
MPVLPRSNQNAKHVFFECPRFYPQRDQLENVLQQSIQPETIVEAMLSSKASWNAITFATEVLIDLRSIERKRAKNNLELYAHRQVVILAKQNFTNSLANEVLEILLKKRLGYNVKIENVTETYDIQKRMKNDSNIISIITCDDPVENQIQKDVTSVNRIAVDNNKLKYCKYVSDQLPFIVHTIVQNLEIDESTLREGAAVYPASEGDDNEASHVYCTDDESQNGWPFYPVYDDMTLFTNINTRRISNSCNWIMQNRAVVNEVVPRVNLKIIIFSCNEEFRNPWLKCVSGLSIQVRYVPCSGNIDYGSEGSFDSSVIGIVAPKPFFQNKEMDIPVIFYDAGYLSPKDLSVFPYAFNDISHGMYKFALCDLMDSLGWSRIAIVSDDSEFSSILNYDLTSYFHERKILYKIEECFETPCDFTKILDDLKAQDAKIIFANIDEENIASLSDAAEKLDMNQWEYVWILRQKLSNTRIFYNHIVMFLQNLELQDCSDSMQYHYLHTMMRIYQETINNKNASFYDDRIIDGWTGYVRDEFKSNFLQRRKDRSGVQAVCVRNWNNKIAYTYKYDAVSGNLYNITHSVLYKDAIPLDRSDCITEASTTVYFTPCKDTLLIIFPLVFLAFFVMFSLFFILTRNLPRWTKEKRVEVSRSEIKITPSHAHGRCRSQPRGVTSTLQASWE